MIYNNSPNFAIPKFYISKYYLLTQSYYEATFLISPVILIAS